MLVSATGANKEVLDPKDRAVKILSRIRIGLTSFTWSLGYVFIMWLMLWFLNRNQLF